MDFILDRDLELLPSKGIGGVCYPVSVKARGVNWRGEEWDGRNGVELRKGR